MTLPMIMSIKDPIAGHAKSHSLRERERRATRGHLQMLVPTAESLEKHKRLSPNKTEPPS